MLDASNPFAAHILGERSMTAKRFFSYDPNAGIEFHATAAEAEAAADSVLDGYRDNAPEGWDENVESVCWGEVRQQVMETERRPATPDDAYYPDCTQVVDYQLLNLVD